MKPMETLRGHAPATAALLGLALVAGAWMNDANASAPDQAPPGEHREPPPGAPHPGHRPRDPAFTQALEECATALGITLPKPGDTGGKPPAPPQGHGREAMDACLKDKGVQPPPPPPPRD